MIKDMLGFVSELVLFLALTLLMVLILGVSIALMLHVVLGGVL